MIQHGRADSEAVAFMPLTVRQRLTVIAGSILIRLGRCSRVVRIEILRNPLEMFVGYLGCSP